MTCDQDHDYTAEQQAADHGAEDLYPSNTGKQPDTGAVPGRSTTYLTHRSRFRPDADSNEAVMDYYDGNTVTGLWNYAQHFAMSDNAYTTTYGPSTPGALNVTSAQTYGAICGPTSATINDPPCAAPAGHNTTDARRITTSPPRRPGGRRRHRPSATLTRSTTSAPTCRGPTAATATPQPKRSRWAATNIGDELTHAGITWGWFEGGFDDGYVPGHGTTADHRADLR